MTDLLANADIAIRHFGWKTVKRNGVPTLVTPKGKHETPPDFVKTNKEVVEAKPAQPWWW